MLHVIGGGGHASVVVDVARRAGMTGFTLWSDDSPRRERFPAGTRFHPLGDLDPSLAVVLGIGDLPQRARLRARYPVYARPIIDPSAVLGGGVRVADGAVIFPTCALNANATVEADAILNTGCIVEHDCVVGENAHLSPGVRLAGGVVIGRGVHVGTGGIVLPGVRIGHGSVVGAGAVVTRDVPEGVTVVGVPAKVLARR